MIALFERLFCWLGWHEAEEINDAGAPYVHRCVRCAWTHPDHGKF